MLGIFCFLYISYMKVLVTLIIITMNIGVFAQTQPPVKISEFLKDKSEPTINGIFEDIQQFRDSLNLSPVQLDKKLCEAAQLQANWIAHTGLFQHNQTCIGDSTITEILPRSSDRGNYVGVIVKGENLHTGWNLLPEYLIVKSWGISPDHRANLCRIPPPGNNLLIGLAIAHYKKNPNQIVVVLTIGESTK